MSDNVIELDAKGFEKAAHWFNVVGPKRLMPAVTRGMLNDMAFLIKNQTKKTMGASFSFKSAKTRKYLESAVSVKKARASTDIDRLEAFVGVINGGENSRAGYKRNIVKRQELGGRLRQVDSSGSSYRGNLMVRADTKKTTTFFKKAGIYRNNERIKNPKQRMAVAIDQAFNKGKKYTTTPYGIYKVLKTKAKLVRKFKKAGSVSTPRSPWYNPAVKKSLLSLDKIYGKNFNRQLKKYELK